MSHSQTLSLPSAAGTASADGSGALAIVQAGRLPQAAYGEMSASHGDYTILTTNSGRGGISIPTRSCM